MSAYEINVTVHLLAALFWLGGLFFLAAVGAPILRRVEPAALRAELFRRLGERFRVLGWLALAILVATGVLNLHFLGLLRGDVLASSSFWASSYGAVLAWKLAFVAAMLGVQALHDFVFGPRASQLDPGSTEAGVYRRRAALLARASALLGLLVVVSAVRLARGR